MPAAQVGGRGLRVNSQSRNRTSGALSSSSTSAPTLCGTVPLHVDFLQLGKFFLGRPPQRRE